MALAPSSLGQIKGKQHKPTNICKTHFPQKMALPLQFFSFFTKNKQTQHCDVDLLFRRGIQSFKPDHSIDLSVWGFTSLNGRMVVNVYRYFLIVVREKVNSAFVRARRVLSWSPFCANPDWRYPTSHVSTFFNESIPSTTEQSRKINGQASTMTYTSNSIGYSFTDSLVFIHRNELT